MFASLVEEGRQCDMKTTQVIQGALERSNVGPIDEMVEMIALQRGFEAGAEGDHHAGRIGEAAHRSGRKDRRLTGGITMIRALKTAATGMLAQQLNVDNIANNLANINTTGFKRSKVEFQDLFYQATKASGSVSRQGTQNPSRRWRSGTVRCRSRPRGSSPRARSCPPAIRWTWP